MKRQMELFLIYFVTDTRIGFSWRKNHATDQKTRTEDNDLISKESRTKTRRRHKKITTGLPKRTRTEGY